MNRSYKMSGIKIERLADSVVNAIQAEMDVMSKDDLVTFDHERFINEEIDRQMPTGNWEFTEFLADDSDLAWESDIVTFDSLKSGRSIFRFIQLRIFEEVERHVRDATDGWFDLPDHWSDSPDDFSDDNWALMSAGFDDESTMSGEVL